MKIKSLDLIYFENRINFLILILMIWSMVSLAYIRPIIFGYNLTLNILLFFFLSILSLSIFSLRLKFIVNQPNLLVLLFLFSIWVSISQIFADSFTLRPFFSLLFYLAFVVVMISIRSLSIPQLSSMLVSFQCVLVILSIIGLWGFFSGNSINAQFSFALDNDLGSRNIDTYIIIPGAIISFVSLLLKRRQLFSAVCLVPYLSCIILSFSRGALLICIFLFLICILMILRSRNIIPCVILFLIFLSPVYYLYSESDSFFRMYDRFSIIDDSPRGGLFFESLGFMFDSPLFGIGLGNYSSFTEFYGPLGPLPNAHNSFTNIGAESGVVGFLLLALIFLYPIFAASSKKSSLRKYDNDELFIFYSAVTIQLFLVLISFMAPIYLDAGYAFWFYYSVVILGLSCLDKKGSRRDEL